MIRQFKIEDINGDNDILNAEGQRIRVLQIRDGDAICTIIDAYSNEVPLQIIKLCDLLVEE